MLNLSKFSKLNRDELKSKIEVMGVAELVDLCVELIMEHTVVPPINISQQQFDAFFLIKKTNTEMPGQPKRKRGRPRKDVGEIKTSE